jgi:hypothetical protein
MEAKKIASELLDKFRPHSYNGTSEDAKQNVLITLDVVKSFLPFTDLNTSLGKFCEKQRQFLEEIKEELNK